MTIWSNGHPIRPAIQLPVCAVRSIRFRVHLAWGGRSQNAQKDDQRLFTNCQLSVQQTNRHVRTHARTHTFAGVHIEPRRNCRWFVTTTASKSPFYATTGRSSWPLYSWRGEHGRTRWSLVVSCPGYPLLSLSWPSLCTYYSVRVCVCVFLTLFSRRCLVAIDSAQGGRTDQRGWESRRSAFQSRPVGL